MIEVICEKRDEQPRGGVVEVSALKYQGLPAGSVILSEQEDGACYVWTRPDGVSEFGLYPQLEQACEALGVRVAQWHEELQ